jgi:hypothetical protein
MRQNGTLPMRSTRCIVRGANRFSCSCRFGSVLTRIPSMRQANGDSGGAPVAEIAPLLRAIPRPNGGLA